ncbi:ABC transporter ATP-binding protein [Ornithinimicrobium sp. Arc0846-15]|nr:ABC transporter ATP-binding protein [Ornithinimicrobium laminariae]
MSWSASQGQITCILGPNGAGKSSAIDIATGLAKSQSGQVSVLATDPWQADAKHRANVGVMLQDGGLPQAVKPLALLKHLSKFYVQPWPPTELAATLGLEGFRDTPIRRLSGGQRQRVALAAALIGRPLVAFLDEPTAGLDPHSRREVHELIRNYSDQGSTVVLSTHSFEEAERLADHIVVVAGGHVVAQGSLDEVRAGASLEERFFELTGDKR